MPLLQRLKYPIAALVFILLVTAVYFAFPKAPNCVAQVDHNAIGFDWMCIFRPAVANLFSGHTPYTGLYFNPPWTLFLLAPFAILPPGWGAAAIAVACVASFMVAGARLGMNRISLLIFLATPFIWVNARQGNIDWLVALGASLPPQVGLFLVVIKPQAAIGIVAFWGIQALTEGWGKGRFQGALWEAFRVFAPVTAAYLLSFLIFGLWIIPPVQWIRDPINYSLWPISIPIGLVLMAAAIKNKDLRRAITASPMFSPYLLTYTYSIFFLGLSGWELLAAEVGVIIMFAVAPGFGGYPLRLTP